MMKIFRVLLIILICFPPNVFAATYTVSQSGSGTDYSVATFNALSGDYSDDTFYFSGSITSEIDFRDMYGTEGHPMILDGYQGGSYNALTDSPSSACAQVDRSGGEYALDGTGASFVTVRDFEITDCQYGIAFGHVVGSTSTYSRDILIEDVRLDTSRLASNTGIQEIAIVVTEDWSNNNTNYNYNTIIQDNYVTHWGDTTDDYGMRLHRTRDFIYQRNEVGNSRTGLSWEGDGCEGVHPINGLIQYNYVHDNTESGIGCKYGDDIVIRFNYSKGNGASAQYAGISFSGNMNDVYVYGNRIEGNYWGILYSMGIATSCPQVSCTYNEWACDNVDTGTIYAWSNLIIDNLGLGIKAGSTDGLTTDDITGAYFYNNTIVGNGASESSDDFSGLTLDSGGGSVTGAFVAKNNILIDNKYSTNYTQAYVHSGDTSSTTLDYNMYFTTGQGSDPGSTVDWNGSDQAVSAVETHGAYDDPELSADYEPATEDSPIIDNGADLSGSPGSVTVQGTVYSLQYDAALSPESNWSNVTDGTSVFTLDQDDYGDGWEQGAYVYVDEEAVYSSTGITLWSNMEAAALDGDEFSAGDDIWTLTDAVFATGAKKTGTNGLFCETDEYYASLDVSSDDIITDTQGRLGFWLKVNTWAEWQNILRVESASEYFHVLLLGSDELRFNWYANGSNESYCDTDTANIQTGAWNFIEISWDETDNDIAIYVNGEQKASDNDAISAIENITIIKVGAIIDAVASNADLYIDKFIVSDDPSQDLYDIQDTYSYSDLGKTPGYMLTNTAGTGYASGSSAATGYMQ